MHLDLDIILFLLFLFANLFVNLNTPYLVTTFQQYAIGSKEFTTAGVVLAILAFSYGGEVFYTPLNIKFLLITTGRAISSFITSYYLSRHLHLFEGSCSTAEIMGKLYGNVIQKIIAISGLIYSMFMTAIQIKILALAISGLFNMHPYYSLLLSAAFVISSVSSSQVRVGILMRIIRFSIFGILFPTIAWMIWKNVLNQCNSDPVHLSGTLGKAWQVCMDSIDSPWKALSLLLVFSIPTLYPAQVQSILSTESAAQVKRAFNYVAFFSLIINAFLFWIGLLVYTTCDKWTLAEVSWDLFRDYRGLKGLLGIGIAVLTISAAIANLHAATVLIVNEMQYNPKWNRTSAINFRCYMIVIGLLTVLLALYINDPFKVFCLSSLTFRSIISIPLLFSFMGLSLHRYAVLSAMLVGAITLIAIGCLTSNGSLYDLLPAFYSSLIALWLAQLYLNRCGIRIGYRRLVIDFQQALEKAFQWRPYLSRYEWYSINAAKIWGYLQHQLPKRNIAYVMFSFYVFLTSYCPFYIFSGDATWRLGLEYAVLFPSLCVATFFLMYVFILQQPYMHKIAAVAWPLSNFYFLFIIGGAMLILSNFAPFQSIILVLNIFWFILMTNVRTTLLRLLCACVCLSIFFSCMGQEVGTIDTFLNLKISIVYIILMVFFLLYGLMYYKDSLSKFLLLIERLKSEQGEYNARQFFSQQRIEALAYESDYVLSQLHQQLFQEAGADCHDTILSEAIEKQSDRLKKYFHSIFVHLKHNLYLSTNWVSLDQLLAEIFDALKLKNVYHVPYVIINTKHFYLQCDVSRIKTLLINSFSACGLYKNAEGSPEVYLYIDDTRLSYRLTLLQGKVQKANALSFTITTSTSPPTILPTYKVAEMADVRIVDGFSKEDNRNIENKHIVNAHYGYCEIRDGKEFVTHLYVLPINVQNLTKTFARFSPVVHTQHVTLDAHSLEEEQRFFQKIQQKGCLDLPMVTNVLRLVKIYYAAQRRNTGELFYLHPIAVASILLEMTSDSNVIIAGLLHDVVQNTPLTEAGLSTIFGAEITQIVLSAEQLERDLPADKRMYAAYVQMALHDIDRNAILVKLADILHNARTIHGHHIEKQIEKAILIQDFYILLAEQMYLTGMANELQCYASKALQADKII